MVDALCRELAEPLAEVRRQTLEAFARLAASLPHRPGPVELPDLDLALAVLQTRFEEGHATLTFTSQALPDWFNAFVFYDSLRGVATDLRAVGKRLEGVG